MRAVVIALLIGVLFAGLWVASQSGLLMGIATVLLLGCAVAAIVLIGVS